MGCGEFDGSRATVRMRKDVLVVEAAVKCVSSVFED